MNLANLRLIRDVAQHRSISKAARLNEISQSAASQSVSDLERELGVALFDRATRPLVATAAGKLYLEFCRDVLRREEELHAELDRARQHAGGLVRLAAIYSVGLSEMSQIEASFASNLPEGHLQISYLRPERVWNTVAGGEADLGILSYAESTREMLALPWRNEEMVVAVAPHHRLAARVSVRAEELEGESFIGFDEDLPIQNQIARYLRDHRVTVEIALHFDNLLMIKEAVAHGSGVSLLPKRILQEDLQGGRIVAIPLDPAELFRPLSIVHRRRKVFNSATETLLSILRPGHASLA